MKKECEKAGCVQVRGELWAAKATVEGYEEESADLNAWLEALVDSHLSPMVRECVAIQVRLHLKHVRECRAGSCEPAASKLMQKIGQPTP